jgi:hypothetical protein
MNQTARLIALQHQLLETLRSISDHADALATERCPYRGTEDICHFERGCRNQLPGAEMRVCSGVRLNYSRP